MHGGATSNRRQGQPKIIHADFAENYLEHCHHSYCHSSGKKLPTTAGLVGVMPLTGALVPVWVYLENKGDPGIRQNFTKGALLGILPNILFFLVAILCFKKHFSLPIVLFLSFGSWLVAAVVHQWIIE